MKYKISLFFLLAATFFSSCNKYDIRDDGQYVGVSKITNYVVLTLNGDAIIALVKGDTYTEQGVTATEAGKTVDYTTDGSVDTNTPGVYVINYSAVNADGYSSSVSRTVVVGPGHENPGVDISGTYNYIAASASSTVTKLGDGVYYTTNLWSAATTIPAIFFCLDGLNITIPTQTTGFGGMEGTGVFDPVTGKLTYTVTLLDQGISNSNRRWIKA